MPTTFAFDEVEPAKSEFGFDEVQPAGTEERSLTGKLADLPGKAFDEAIKWGGLGLAGRSLAYALGGPEALKTGEEVVKEVTSKPLVDVPSKAVESMLGVSQYLLPKDVKEGLGEAGKSVFDFLLSPKGAAMTVGAALVPEVGLPAFVAQGELALPDAMEAVRRAESTKEKTAALGNLATTVATILGPVAGGGAARPSPGMEIVPRTRPFRPPRPGPGYVIDVTPLLEEGMQPPRESAALPGTQRPFLPAPGRHVEVTPEGVAADVMQMSPEEHAAFLTATARRGRPPEPRPAVRAGAIAPEALDAGIWEIVSDDALSPVDKFKAIQRIRQQAGNRVYPAEPPIADVFQERIGGTEPPSESGPASPVEPAPKPPAPAPESAPEPQPAAPAAQPEVPSEITTQKPTAVEGVPTGRLTAAVRLPDGEIQTARKGERIHAQILGRLWDEKHPNVISKTDPDVESGWVNDSGQFFTNDEVQAQLGYKPDTLGGRTISVPAKPQKGAPDATQEGQVEGSVQPERVGTDAQRVSAEAGVGDSVRPAAPVKEAVPQAPGAQARDVVLEPWQMTKEERKPIYDSDWTKMEKEAVGVVRQWVNTGILKGHKIKRGNGELAITKPMPGDEPGTVFRITTFSSDGRPFSHMEVSKDQWQAFLKDQSKLRMTELGELFDSAKESVRPDLVQGITGITLDEPMEYYYRLRNRDVGIGTAPKGFTKASGRNVTYNRPLTSKELYDFEIDPIGAKELPPLAEQAPQGVTPPAEPSLLSTKKGESTTGTPETKAPTDVTAPISKAKSAREAVEDIAKKLDELKAPPSGSGTTNVFGFTNLLWNAAIDVAKAIIRAGGTIADAIDAAVGYLARHAKGSWNQSQVRNHLTAAVNRIQQQAARLSNIDNIIGAERLANAPEGVRKTARWVEDHIRGFAWRIANKDPLFQVGSDLNGAQSNATMFTKKVFNDVNNAFLRAIGQSVFEKPYTVLRPWLNKFKTQGTALSFIVESGSDLQQLIFERDMLRMRQWDNAWADKVRQSDWLANKNEALKAYDYAIDNFNSLRPVADFYRSAMDNQIRSEWSNGIETPYRQNYVMQPAEVAGDLGIFGTAEGGAGGGPRFTMKRTYDSFYNGLMNGQTYRTMDGIQTLQQRVYSGMHRILSKQWLEGMRNMTDANGNPLVKDMNPNVITRQVQQFYTNAQGRRVPQASHGWFIQYRNINGVRTPVEARIEFEAPAGYSKFDWHGQPIAVLKGFDTYLHAFTDPSIFARSVPGRFIMNLASTGKHLILQGDIFHMNRLGIWGSAFQMKPSGYNKGLYLMDYSLGELRRMEARGEITPDTLNFAIQNQPYLRIIQKHSGIHFGKIEDNMYSALTEHIPLTGYFNRWLFGEMQRGVMMETALYELKRQMANRPDLTTEQVAKIVGQDINTRFGTLYNQSIIKSKSFRDLARLLFLAPGWNEGLIRSEFRAAKQVATAIPDSVKAERLAIGGMAKAVGTLAVMMFAAGQAANFITRKKPTWENEEEGFDAKLSPWIPDLTGSGPGMFISPLSLPFETSHLIAKRIERNGNFNDAFRQYAQSRLGYFSRPVVTYFTKRDVFDRPIRPEEYRKEMIRSAAPIPISGEAAWSMGKELVQRGVAAATGEQPPGTRQQFPGQYQKQILATAGMKTDSAPSPSQRINALARQFNEAHNVKTQGDFYQSKYADADRFLRIGNTTDAKTAIRDLLKEKTPKDIVDRYSKSTDYLFTRSMAREKAFIATLNPEQLQAYRQAKKDKAEVKNRFFKVWRDMRESGELKP